MNTGHTLVTTASIFLLLTAGYASKRIGVLKASDSSVVTSLVINLTMPAFIFVNTHGKPLAAEMIKAPALGFAMQLVVMVAAYLAARAMRLDRRTTGALMLTAAFGNTGFLGYPVVTAAFRGDETAIFTAVLFDSFSMALALNSIGIAAAACFSGSQFEWRSLLEFLRTPLFPAMVIALLLRNVYVPEVIMITLNYLAAGTVPLAMISIGLNLSAGSLQKHPGAIAVAVALKMVVLPALMLAFLPIAGVAGVVREVAVLESAMPTAVFAGVVAARYGSNGAFAAGVIFVSTLLSIVWIPAVLTILG